MKDTICRQAWILHVARGKTFKEISQILNLGSEDLAILAVGIYEKTLDKS